MSPGCSEATARDKQREHQKSQKRGEQHDDLALKIGNRALQTGNPLVPLVEIACSQIEHAQQERDDPMSTPFEKCIVRNDSQRDIHAKDVPCRNEQRGGSLSVEDPCVLRRGWRMPCISLAETRVALGKFLFALLASMHRLYRCP